MKRCFKILCFISCLSFQTSCAVADYIQNKCRITNAINLEGVSKICLECESPAPLKFASKFSAAFE